MGNCSSCLGRRRPDGENEDEETRRLFEDPTSHYGSFGDQNAIGADDPLETQQEAEALQRVVAKTSVNMIDVFEIAPPQHDSLRPTLTPFAYAGEEARTMRYQTLLSRLSANEEGGEGIKVDWIAQEQEQELDDSAETREGSGIVGLPKTGEDDKALVGTFADAAAAMT